MYAGIVAWTNQRDGGEAVNY